MKGIVKHLYRGVILILILVVGWFAGLYSGKQLAHNQVRLYLNNYTALNSKLSRVLTMIEKDYVDSISRDSLAELAIPAILHFMRSYLDTYGSMLVFARCEIHNIVPHCAEQCRREQ